MMRTHAIVNTRADRVLLPPQTRGSPIALERVLPENSGLNQQLVVVFVNPGYLRGIRGKVFILGSVPSDPLP